MNRTILDGRASRRRILAAAGAGVGAALAGCLGDGGAAPDPVTLTDEDRCDMCGMVITNHPGPVAQIFYADRQPEGHDNPARFCSGWEAFQYDFERRDEGWEREAFYATDYSGVEYEITTDGGQQFISSHPEAAAFGDATALTFDAGSAVLGAMGKDLVGFAESADAEAFADEHGGEVVGFDEVTRQLVSELGMN